jgi:hypothetical protein
MDYLCFLCCPVPVYHRKVELILHAGSTWLALAAFAETEPSDSANPAIAENLIQSTGDIRCPFKAASVAAEPCGPPAVPCEHLGLRTRRGDPKMACLVNACNGPAVSSDKRRSPFCATWVRRPYPAILGIA